MINRMYGVQSSTDLKCWLFLGHVLDGDHVVEVVGVAVVDHVVSLKADHGKDLGFAHKCWQYCMQSIYQWLLK